MSNATRRQTLITGAASLLALSLTAPVALAQNYDDGNGKEWLQINRFLNTSWNQIAAKCPTNGTPCTGTIAGVDVTGWTWASQDDVRTLFSYSVPEILNTPTLSGPEYMAVALFFMDFIKPTWQYYTTFGGYLYTAGWTSTQNEDGTAILAQVSSQYPVFDGYWSVAGANLPTFSSNTLGAWFWRSTAPPCPADLNGDTIADILDFLHSSTPSAPAPANPPDARWKASIPTSSTTAQIDILDFLEYMDRFGNGCEG
jgi:hypothetical protein